MIPYISVRMVAKMFKNQMSFDEFKNFLKKRSSSERRNKRVENDRVRSKSRWLIRIIMRDSALHADSWIKQKDINLKKWVLSWLGISLEDVAY
jgi:hypothetical protein